MPQTTSKGSRSRDLVSAGSELLSPYRAKRNVVIKKSLGSVFPWWVDGIDRKVDLQS